MRLVLGSFAAVLSLALAACDIGGGSSNPTPTPTPTPMPTPTTSPSPTPSPTAITYTTSEAGLQYTAEGGVQRVANTHALPPTMGTVFSYTPALGGYSYLLLNGSVAPSPSETAVFTVPSIKTCDVTALCYGNGFVFQQVPAGTGSYYMSRFVTGPGNPLLVLLDVGFGTFGEALLDSTAGPRLHVDLRPFAYGVASTGTAIPTTGTVTFNGLIVGQATGNKPGATGTSNIYSLTGTFQLVANFAASTATLKITVAGDSTGCTPACSPDINLTYDSTAGTIASGVMSFTLPGGGTARFFLAGTAASEVGGTLALSAADPNEAAVTMVVAGSAGGRR